MPLQREGLITLWADTDINAGADWKKEIDLHLNTSHIILLLVSSDFMASEYCYSIEMQQAMQRHERGEAQVVPIILRSCSWKQTPLGKLQALPPNAKPITKWPNRDAAFYETAEKLRDTIEACRTTKSRPVTGPVIEGYRLLKQLRTGTFGILYLAEQEDSGTQVVLKVVSVPRGLRLGHEMYSLGTNLVGLHHPSILPTLEVNLDAVPPYVVTTIAAGGSLAQRIQQQASHPFPLPEAFAIIAQVGEALAYLHQQHHIIHRAIQPACIMFDSAGKALLTGFDLAMWTSASRHTLQSYRIWATDYRAPEQSKGSTSEKSDQYALGCIAYELCTGRRLKDAGSLAFSLWQRPRSPRQFNPALSDQAERAIFRAVKAHPDDRYESVKAFVTALGTP